MGVAFPPGFEPEGAPVSSFNELVIQAPRERIWEWLVRAPLWPTFYPNCKRLVIESGPPDQLAAGSAFRWTTFGVRVRTIVEEFAPPERLGWSGSALGARGYHGWVLESRAGGACRVVTEEVQRGWLPSLGRLWLGRRLVEAHDVWLQGLARAAQQGPPPDAR